jgi:glycine cleavage system H lipoate-binding protein
MTISISSRRRAKEILTYVAVAVGTVVVLPLLAVLAFGLRFLLPILIVGLVIALVVSPAFRRRFITEAETDSKYQGVLVPMSNLWVHPNHSWARLEGGGSADVGVDDLVQKVLGRVKAIEMPVVGTRVEQGVTLFSIVCEGRRLDIKAPLGGVVSEINDDVAARPSLVNEGPYGKGWVVRLADANKTKERRVLTHGVAARCWFKGEVDRMMLILTGNVGGLPALNDGGTLVADLSAQIDPATWDQVKSALFEV